MRTALRHTRAGAVLECGRSANVTGWTSYLFSKYASSDAEIYVTVRDAMKQEYRAVLVNAATGRTELWKYNGTIWIRMTQ